MAIIIAIYNDNGFVSRKKGEAFSLGVTFITYEILTYYCFNIDDLLTLFFTNKETGIVKCFTFVTYEIPSNT